jgi:hypothetical protein
MKSIMPACLILLACASATALRADDPAGSLRFVIPASTFAAPSPEDLAAMTEAACDGTAAGGVCDTCPDSSPGAGALGGGFTLRHVIAGHFLRPDSDDAMATVSGCEQIHGSVAWGILFTRRDGEWEAVDQVIGLDLDHCRGMQFSSGTQLLLYEDYRMASFILMHSVTAVFAKGQEMSFQNLLLAADTTRLCSGQPRVQKAQIDRIAFRGLNDGREVIDFTASFGTLPDSRRRQQLCDEAARQARRPQTGAGGEEELPHRVRVRWPGIQADQRECGCGEAVYMGKLTSFYNLFSGPRWWAELENSKLKAEWD